MNHKFTSQLLIFNPELSHLRIYKRAPDSLLPIHQNDLKRDVKIAGNCDVTYENTTAVAATATAITPADLETISTEIHRLEKEDSFEAINVKGASPAAKPTKSSGQLPQQTPKRRPTQQRFNNLVNVTQTGVGKTRDYGNFDFCVVEKKKLNVDGNRLECALTPGVSPPGETRIEEAFPRRRRTTNRFANAPSSSDAVGWNEDVKEKTRIEKGMLQPRENASKFSACNLCFCSALISLTFISLAVLILIHPTVQLYLKLNMSYIHVLNPPV